MVSGHSNSGKMLRVPSAVDRVRRRFADVPMNDVDPVAEKIGEMAPAEIPEPAPVRAAHRIERLIGSRAQEAFPIDIGGRGGFERCDCSPDTRTIE